MRSPRAKPLWLLHGLVCHFVHNICSNWTFLSAGPTAARRAAARGRAISGSHCSSFRRGDKSKLNFDLTTYSAVRWGIAREMFMWRRQLNDLSCFFVLLILSLTQKIILHYPPPTSQDSVVRKWFKKNPHHSLLDWSENNADADTGLFSSAFNDTGFVHLFKR